MALVLYFKKKKEKKKSLFFFNPMTHYPNMFKVDIIFREK